MRCLLRFRFLAVAASFAFASACGTPTAPPARTAPAARPAPSSSPAASFAAAQPVVPEIATRPVAIPAINHATLPNGLHVWHVGSRTIPTVHVRLVVRTGNERPALARLTAQAVERARHAAPIPGAPKPPAPPLQADVSVHTSPGAAVFSLDLPRDAMEPAFDLIGTMVRQPKLESAPITSLRAAETGRALAVAKDDPATLARDFAAADLLDISVSDDVNRILPVDLKTFHKTWYTPRTMGIVVAGDVTFDEAMEAARRAFGSWDAPAPQPAAARAPAPAQYTRVIVIDRPQASDAVVVIAAPGAPVSDAVWPSLWLLRELLTQGVNAQRCPDSASDLISARVSGAPIVSCFQPPVDKLSATVASALERARLISKTDPAEGEVRAARSAWNDQLATRLASIPAIADFAASALAAGMDHDAPSRFLTQLNAVAGSDVREAARSRLAGGALVVVAADASRTADELSRFGDVVVVDPQAGFARKRQIPANPNAAAPAP